MTIKNKNSKKYFLFISILFWTAGHIFSQNKNQEIYTFDLDVNIPSKLKKATTFSPEKDVDNGISLSLPDPKGNYTEYFFFRNEIMSAEMITKYPTISTYTGYSPTQKHHFVNLVLHEDKIHVFILSNEKKGIMIDKTTTGKYQSYFGEKTDHYVCSTDQSHGRNLKPSGLRTSTNGATLRTYDLAIVITDEYEAANGGGATAIAQAVSTVSNMSTIYKRDLAVTFTATVRPETATYDVVYPGGASAYYATLVVSKYFTSGEYDLGHVFHNAGGGGGGGQANFAVVCSNTDGNAASGNQPVKGGAWSTGNPNNNYGFLSIVAHETGHQFGADHTFNSNDPAFCSPSINAATSYEPGSGSSLMAYPGVCPVGGSIGQNLTDAFGNILNDSDPYFHTRSLEQMVAFITVSGNSCASGSSTGNTPPTANASVCSTTSIPTNTPFQLTGNHTDSNNDAVTYCWEQFDAGPTHGGPSVNCGTSSGPIFRSYPPNTSPTRHFPSLYYILNNNNVPLGSVGECLPTAARTLNFKLTVRDNNAGGGGIDVSSIQVIVNSTVGPLVVTSPNTNVTWTSGSSQTVTWTGFNSSSLCNSMNILLSVDGGLTFPFTLAANTPNDGTQSVTIPSIIPGGSARIKVEGNCHSCVKFFDISNTNFTISSSCMVSVSNSVCPPNSISVPFGDPALNLGLIASYGSTFTSKILITSGSTASVGYNLIPASSGPGTCTFANFGYAQTSVRFKISVAGVYTFALSSYLPLSIYNGTYSPASPCTNYIGSTAYDLDGVPFDQATFSNNIQVTLNNACGDYTAVLFGPSGSGANLSISGPPGSTIHEHYPPSLPNYSYTFLAVNSATGIIVTVNASSNFSSLSGGTYFIYGVAYYTGAGPNPPNVNPSSWVGTSVSSLIGANSCHVVSGNSKTVTVSCPTTIVSSTGNSGTGTLRDIFGCLAEGSTITFNAGVNPTLTAPLLLNKNIIIDGNVDGSNNPVTNVNLNFTGTYGIKIDPLKTITLKDVKVNMLGSAVPVVQNEGNLTLNNAEIIGNVNPVINHASGATLQVINKVAVKKQ